MVENKSSMRVIGTAQEPFFPPYFNSVKKPSIVLLRIGINLHGILSRTYIKIPPPLAFRSDLKISSPSMLNYMEGNDSSSFVSDIINTSSLTRQHFL